MAIDVNEALAKITARANPQHSLSQVLASMPMAKKPEIKVAKAPQLKAPTDPADPKPSRNTGTRLALREVDTGEFASVAEAIEHPEKVVTDYIDLPKSRKSSPAKKQAVKKATKKAVAKKVAAKKNAKKVKAKR